LRASPDRVRIPVFRRAASNRFWLALGIVLLGFNLRTASSSVPPVLTDMGLPAAVAGVQAASPAICFGLLAFASPWVRRRWGVERGLLWALSTLVGGLILRSLLPPIGYLPGSLIAGIGVAVMNVLLPILVRARFAQSPGPITAAYLGSLTLGGGAAAALTVPIRHLVGDSVPLALLAWLAPALVALALWLPHAVASPDAGARVARPVPLMWSRPLAWQVTLFFGLQSLVYFGTLSWLPTYYRSRGLSAEEAGLLLALMNTIGIVGNVVTPLLATRIRDQRAALIAVTLFMVAGLAGVVWGAVGLAPAWVVLLGLGGSGAFALGLLLIVLRSADPEAAVALSTMTQGVGYLLSGCGPLLVDAVHALTGDWAVGLVALLLMLAPQFAFGWGAARNRVVGTAG